MARRFNPVLTPCSSQMPNRRRTYTREAPTARATIQQRQARVPHLTPKQVRVPTLAPRPARAANLPLRQDQAPSSGSIHTWALASTRKGPKTSKKPPTSRTPNKPFGEGPSGVKKTLQVRPTRQILIGTIPVDIPVAEVMVTSYSEEVTAPKTLKVKFV